MTTDVLRAEQAVYRRTRAAFLAAGGEAAGYRAWEQDGLLVTSTRESGLWYLSTVCGVTAANVHAVPEVVRQGESLTALLSPGLEAAAVTAGLAHGADQLLAIRQVTGSLPEPGPAGPEVVPAADTDEFVDVLLAGYGVGGRHAAYIAAEHRLDSMHRFLAVGGGEPIAAAALSVHDGVAVVGGASTMPGHRGEGGQAALLRHRLALAAELGCDLVVGTAAADSTSGRNLLRAGFRVIRRSGWASPGDAPPR